MVSLPPVGGLVTIRDKSDESGVVLEIQKVDGLVTGGAAVGVQGVEQRRKNTALGGNQCWRRVFPASRAASCQTESL